MHGVVLTNDFIGKVGVSVQSRWAAGPFIKSPQRLLPIHAFTPSKPNSIDNGFTSHPSYSEGQRNRCATRPKTHNSGDQLGDGFVQGHSRCDRGWADEALEGTGTYGVAHWAKTDTVELPEASRPLPINEQAPTVFTIGARSFRKDRVSSSTGGDCPSHRRHRARR